MAERPRSDHSDRSKAERIDRLRQRLPQDPPPELRPVVAVLKGLLDLLADEL